jgi:hypothetical protein
MGGLFSSFSSLFPLFSTARSLPYSLSSLQLVLFPIPSLLYSSFSSLFPLFSTARSLPYSLSSLQLVLFPIPYLLYSSFSPPHCMSMNTEPWVMSKMFFCCFVICPRLLAWYKKIIVKAYICIFWFPLWHRSLFTVPCFAPMVCVWINCLYLTANSHTEIMCSKVANGNWCNIPWEQLGSFQSSDICARFVEDTFQMTYT